MSQRFWLQQLGFLTVLAALTLVLTGCGGSKVTKENADKVKNGMTEAEVTGILGAPTETPSETKAGPLNVKTMTWKAGSGADTKGVVVVISDGKVTMVTKIGM